MKISNCCIEGWPNFHACAQSSQTCDFPKIRAVYLSMCKLGTYPYPNAFQTCVESDRRRKCLLARQVSPGHSSIREIFVVNVRHALLHHIMCMLTDIMILSTTFALSHSRMCWFWYSQVLPIAAGIWPRCSECWCICTGWYCGCVLANHSSWSSSQRCDKGGLSVRIGCDNDGLIVSYNPRACPHSSCIFFKARISDALWKHVIIMRIFVANLVGLVPTSIWCLNFTTYSSFMSR